MNDRTSRGRMRRSALLGLCVALSVAASAAQRRRTVSPGGPATLPAPAAGEALAGLTVSQVSAFNAGREVFRRDESVASGLGPVFNEESCGQCHDAGALGGGSNRIVIRFARLTNGVFDPMTKLGGSLQQDRAIASPNGEIHNFIAEVVPPSATIVARRRSPPLFGLGLVEATPDETFVTLASTQAARGDGTAGRVNMTDNIRAGVKTVGRFGWKAQVPSLVQFAGDALLNEMGITNPDFPNESCPQGNCAELAFNPAPGLNDTGTRQSALADYMALLAAPPRGPQNPDTSAGEQVFNAIGCGGCHAGTLTTGASPVAALDRQTYHPYSDFLLHDMGSLGDGIEMENSSGTEMRTAPLWGLRFVLRYLHDSRALTLDGAITAHDGQARAARDRYSALAADVKAQVIAFLRSL